MRALAALPLLLLLACQADSSPVPGPVAPEVAAEKITISLTVGDATLSATRTSKTHWRLEDGEGEKVGKISVEPDRVKVKDAAGQLRAKVKLRKAGLKLEDGAGAQLVRLKMRGGERFDLELESGEVVGTVDGRSGTLRGVRVEAEPIENGFAVKTSAEPISVRGPVLGGAAVAASYPGLDIYQRLALLVFVYAVRPG